MERRLAVILAADVVGYSRLMEADEEATVRTLGKYREIIDGLVTGHHGRVFGSAGDSVIAEFASPVEAVRCAVDIQRELEAHNNDLPEDRRMHLRIGINLGDVIVEGDNLLGDGVNIAARLEAIAEPGGIALARSVFGQVKKQLDLGYEYLGEHEVKNIAEPIRVYRVLTDPEAVGKVIGEVRRATQSWMKLALAAAVVVLIGVVGAVTWLRPWEPTIEPASVERMAHPLPDKPSIAVLPFTNLSDDPAQEYFADGMTEDVITDLSKVSGLFVIARNSVFTYKGKAVTVRQVAEELGVRYVLEGSVRRAGEQVRINAQLIDATTGGHLWAERYDGDLGDVFGLQDKVTRQIVAVLAVQLTQGEAAQVALRETASTEAYDAFLQGWEQYLRQTPESLGTAIGHFERAVELDPDYARAHAALSATYWQISQRFWQAQFGFRSANDARFRAEEILSKASRQPTALSHQLAAAMLSQQGRHTEAIAEGGKAIGIDPNNADSYVALAGALSLAGNSGEALQLVRKAMRLNPHYPPSYLYELGLAEFGTGNFRAAAEALEQATGLNPQDRWSYRLLLAAYGHLGREADAARIVEIISGSWRGNDPITIRAIAFWYPFKEPADRERLAAGLRAANVPD
jgi:TolB-like protein/class 3 adenylate cyclase